MNLVLFLPALLTFESETREKKPKNLTAKPKTSEKRGEDGLFLKKKIKNVKLCVKTILNS